jgi:hypothetical protein
MDTALWGRDAWQALEVLCEPQGRRVALAQATLLKATLVLCPCVLCQQSAQQLQPLLPLDRIATGAEAALPWLWRLHNWVNTKLDKPLFPYSKLRKRLRMNRMPEAMQLLSVVRFLGWVGAHSKSFYRPEMRLLLLSIAELLQAMHHHRGSVRSLRELAQAAGARDQRKFFEGLAALRNQCCPVDVLDGRGLQRVVTLLGRYDPPV